MPGLLTVHPTNSRYVTDGSGKAVVLTGSHFWWELQTIDNVDPVVEFDWNAYLDFVAGYDHNFIRGWCWEESKWSAGTTAPEFIQPEMYLRTGPGNAADGKLKFDLTQVNPAYLSRLRARAVTAGHKGIYLSVMLFNGWSVRNITPEFEPWHNHPYKASNNVNSIDGDPNANGDGREVHTLDIPAVTALQENYVEAVIDALNDLPNVIFEISNESHVGSEAWQEHMVDHIIAYELTKPKQHLVWRSSPISGGQVASVLASSAQIVSFTGADGYGDPPANSSGKVIINDSDHVYGIGGDREFLWRSFCRGTHPIFMDTYNGLPYDSGAGTGLADATFISYRQNMGYIRIYSERMDLAGMTPQNALSTTGYCLAKAAAAGEYLAYQGGTGAFDVDLSATPGELYVEWLNPATGAVAYEANVTGGGVETFTPPFAGDAVLYLKSVPAAAATGLKRRAIDIMDITKSQMREALPDDKINNHLDTIDADFPTLNTVSIAVVNNTQAEAALAGVAPFNEEPWARKNRIMDRIHANGHAVDDRATDSWFEGNYNFPKLNKRNGNRYTYFATPIRDSFSSVLARNHGYGRSSDAGSLANYILANQTGNSWSVQNGELVGPAGNGWRRAIYFNATNLRDLTMVAKVQKKGNQSIVIRGQQDTNNFPGYGLQMRNTNILRIEDNGRSSKGEVAKTWVENSWYWMKFQGIGSALKGKAWLADDAAFPNSVDGSENEPAAWDIEVTDTSYSTDLATYCGFSGESSFGHFKHLSITPVKDADTWLARYLDKVVANIAHYQTGDNLGAYPEASSHFALNNQGSYVQFFTDLDYCARRIGQAAGKHLRARVGHLFTAALQNSYNTIYAATGMASYDHYGPAIGLNKESLSWPTSGERSTAGSDTYAVPTSITENSANRFDFVPEKSAYAKRFRIFVANKGTGDLTLTVHGPNGLPVRMYDHKDLNTSWESHTVTIPNELIIPNAYNYFWLDWVNLDTDQVHHGHLTQTGTGATVRVVVGNAGNLNQVCATLYRHNARLEAMEIDIRNMFRKTGLKQSLKEWGDFWSLDPTRSSPVRTHLQHVWYLQGFYEMIQRLVADGILEEFQYWRSGFGTEELYNNASGPSYTYVLNYRGRELQKLFAGNNAALAAEVPFDPSGLTATAISQTVVNLSWTDNSADETGFRIERKTVGGTFAEIATVGAGVTTYPNSGLAAGTQYVYRVRAYNASGNSGYSDEATATTQESAPVPTVPTAPSGLTATALSHLEVQVSWTDNSSDETGFLVERRTGNGSFVEIQSSFGPGVTGFVDDHTRTGPPEAVAPETTYTYRVRAFNNVGNSPYSAEATVTTPAAPVPTASTWRRKYSRRGNN